MRWEHVSIPSIIGTERLTRRTMVKVMRQIVSRESMRWMLEAETRVVESWGSGQW